MFKTAITALAGFLLFGSAAHAQRQKLTGSLDLFVGAQYPYTAPQHAITAALNNYDTQGNRVRIWVSAGSYPSILVDRELVGGGQIEVYCSGADPDVRITSPCSLNAAGTAYADDANGAGATTYHQGRLYLEGFGINACRTNGLRSRFFGELEYARIRFLCIGGADVYADRLGYIEMLGDVAIAPTQCSQAHVIASHGANVRLTSGAILFMANTCFSTATIYNSAIADVTLRNDQNSFVQFDTNGFTVTTPAKVVVESNAVIQWGGKPCSQNIPGADSSGNPSPCVTGFGGQYVN
jgi:hypothetical protein